MKEINGIPSVIEGIAYYPYITVPNEKYKPAFYEVSMAVSDETFDRFKSRGYASCFPAGDRKFTPDPVIVFSLLTTRMALLTSILLWWTRKGRT